jgi:hypothetical protein
MTPTQRNELRKQASLPLLDQGIEKQRQEAVEREAAFERYYQLNRDRFADLWADAGLGWLSRAGLWAQARRQLRLEFEAIVGK